MPFQFRRLRIQNIILLAFGVLSALFLLVKYLSHARSTVSVPQVTYHAPSDVVLVTVFRDVEDAGIRDHVVKNREDYAKKHGYNTFFPMASNYSIKSAPLSWAKVPAMRHAMAIFPDAAYFFYLDPHTLIMNPTIDIQAHIMAPQRLESLMITDVPIVPPDSVIKTFSGLKGERVDFVLTQDKEGLSEKSFIIRRGEWAKYLLDAWFDPLYRSYNFQKAERHALEHIIQWHGTILAKLTLVPQNIMNSYHEKISKVAQPAGVYKTGDFIITFGDCEEGGKKCEDEMKPYFGLTPQSENLRS